MCNFFNLHPLTLFLKNLQNHKEYKNNFTSIFENIFYSTHHIVKLNILSLILKFSVHKISKFELELIVFQRKF